MKEISVATIEKRFVPVLRQVLIKAEHDGLGGPFALEICDGVTGQLLMEPKADKLQGKKPSYKIMEAAFANLLPLVGKVSKLDVIVHAGTQIKRPPMLSKRVPDSTSMRFQIHRFLDREPRIRQLALNPPAQSETSLRTYPPEPEAATD